MSRTCIVVSPPVFQGQSIADGFRKCGWDAQLVTFTAKPRRSMANPVNWLRKPEPGRDVTKRFDYVLREHALPMAERCRADLLLVFRPDECGARTEAALAAYRRPIVSWVIDSLCRVPSQNSLAPFTVADFFLDGGDAGGPKSFWLPLGVDEDLIARSAAEKEIDLLFIGNLERPFYSARNARFHELLKSSIPERFRCSAVVSAGGRFRDEVLKGKAPFPLSRAVGIEEYVRCIAGATLCVNIMPSDGTSPINDAFMIIPASGTCQLTDHREFLAEWLRPELEFAWFEEAAMLDTLEAMLADTEKTRSIAKEGQRAALAHHTYAERARTIAQRAGIG